MARKNIAYTDHYAAVMKALTTRGLLVGAYDDKGKPNLMTIGWGSLGTVWGKPMWVVLVRPSRYTYHCIEKHKCFSVNVPPPEMEEACTLCGTRSGRDTDKFKACGLTAERAGAVEAPVVAECPLVYECKVVHWSDVVSPHLAEEILTGAYAGGDFHRIYWGEIVAARAAPGAAKSIGP
jgi:flavin reductase (DIM6/NTAB) family NADH-FMN oxidoreductase RutF